MPSALFHGKLVIEESSKPMIPRHWGRERSEPMQDESGSRFRTSRKIFEDLSTDYLTNSKSGSINVDLFAYSVTVGNTVYYRDNVSDVHIEHA